ncbi:hypothetical protein GEMRC1_010015 [Eukaryota sp. GEM-RC1]
MLQVCFSGKINHFLRSLDYSLTETFAKKFNSIRTNFLSNLAEIDESKIPFHAFYSSEFAGVGFTHAKIIRKSALLGGVKNFMFEFLKRFPLDGINLLNSSNCRWIQSAKDLLSSLSPEMWESLFPAHLKETPLKNISSLPSAFELLDFNNRISLAKTNSPEFAAFLIDLCNSGPSGFISQIPKVYGLHLSDEAWMINMRLRLAIWPANLLNYSTCSCGANGVFRHLINCRYFIHLRAVIHDGVRDSCYSMFKAHGFHSKVEPVLNHLSENEFTDQKRGDLHTPWLKSSQALMDFTTVDVCNKSCVSRILDSSFNPLTAAEKLKHTKYDSQVEELNRNSYSKFVFQPFAVSLLDLLVLLVINFSRISKNCVKKRSVSLEWLNGKTV